MDTPQPARQGPSFLQDLNREQQQAVVHTDGPLLVLAGAGSGKTRVLTNRIAYLLAVKKVSPRKILAVTFTNKAAGEMKRRVQELVGLDSRNLWIGTFHSTCVRILRREAEHIGYNSDFVIYDRDDQLALVRSVIKDLDLSDKQFPPRSLVARISQLKNQMVSAGDYRARVNDFREQKVAKVYQTYQDRLLENNAFDFDDLIMKTVCLFRDTPEVLAQYQNRFTYVLVDEYQDTNRPQYLLVTALTGSHRNVCVVGDDDQSIYGWRGADITNILNFDRDFPEAAVIRLEQNYRSTKNILQAASSVIRHNRGRKGKELWSNLEQGDRLSVVDAFDEQDEALTVTNTLQKLRNGAGWSYNDMAVLYRTNAQSRVLEEALRKATVPYVIVGSIRFYERKEIKDILAYLRVIANPRDTVSLKRIINIPRREIGGATINHLEAYAFEKGLHFYRVFECLEEVGGVPAKKKKKLAEFWELIKRHTELSEKQAVVDLTASLLEEIRYIRDLETQKDPESLARLDNIQELLVGMEEYQERNEDPGLKPFLAEVSLLTDVDSWNDRSDQVTLMTLHCAKGLEFPVVFITGLEEGLFPLAQSFEKEEDLEEERRLFYVGVTRAKKKVYLTYAQHRRRYEQTLPNLVSRFIEEVPRELTERKRGIRAEAYAGSAPAPAVSRIGPRQSSGTGTIEVGMQVEHPHFGQGVITAKRGVGDTTQVTVNFPQVGTRKLMLKFAKLRPA